MHLHLAKRSRKRRGPSASPIPLTDDQRRLYDESHLGTMAPSAFIRMLLPSCVGVLFMAVACTAAATAPPAHKTLVAVAATLVVLSAVGAMVALDRALAAMRAEAERGPLFMAREYHVMAFREVLAYNNEVVDHLAQPQRDEAQARRLGNVRPQLLDALRDAEQGVAVLRHAPTSPDVVAHT